MWDRQGSFGVQKFTHIHVWRGDAAKATFIRSAGALVALVVALSACSHSGKSTRIEENCPLREVIAARGMVVAAATVGHQPRSMLLVGAERTGDHGRLAYALVETDANGAWTKGPMNILDQSSDGSFEAVTRLSSKGSQGTVRQHYLLAGTRRGKPLLGESLGAEDGVVTIVDTFGAVVQSMTLGGPYEDVLSRVVVMAPGKVWLLGTTRSSGSAEGSSGWLVDLRAAGDGGHGETEPQWVKHAQQTVGSGYSQGLVDAAKAGDEVVALGWRQGSRGQTPSPWILRWHASGKVVSERTLDNLAGAWPTTVAMTAGSHGLWLAGRRGERAWLGEFSGAAALLSERTIGPKGAGQVATSLVKTAHGWMVGGSVIRPNRGLAGFFVVATQGRQSRWSRLATRGLPLYLLALPLELPSANGTTRYVASSANGGNYGVYTFEVDHEGRRRDCR